MVKVVPRPGVEAMETRPPSACTAFLTTSMPTPRPDRLDTVPAVEKPGRKSRLSISGSESSASPETSPFSTALARMRSRSSPAPSSPISMKTLPERCAAERRIVPTGSLPLARRVSGFSSPWSTALRTMWVSGSASRSITVLSTSVLSPRVTSLAFLPVASEASRTMRDMRWKSGFTGWARIAMTPSWMSRASSL